MKIAQIMGLSCSWMGWILIELPTAFSLVLSRGSIPILSAISLLLLIAIFMPGNLVWYSETFLFALLTIMMAVTIELYRRRMTKMAIPLGVVLLITVSLTMVANFGKNKNYPWNENSPAYLAYQEVGKSSVGDGKYVINRYSNEPVRVRICQIGIVPSSQVQTHGFTTFAGSSKLELLKAHHKAGLGIFIRLRLGKLVMISSRDSKTTKQLV
jgi:energy-coupling factor transporter transmembrane protein EcfT